MMTNLASGIPTTASSLIIARLRKETASLSVIDFAPSESRALTRSTRSRPPAFSNAARCVRRQGLKSGRPCGHISDASLVTSLTSRFSRMPRALRTRPILAVHSDLSRSILVGSFYGQVAPVTVTSLQCNNSISCACNLSSLKLIQRRQKSSALLLRIHFWSLKLQRKPTSSSMKVDIHLIKVMIGIGYFGRYELAGGSASFEINCEHDLVNSV